MISKSAINKAARKIQLSALISLLSFGAVVGTAGAQASKTMDNLKGAANKAGFSTNATAGPAEIIGNIIFVALGLLGVIFVILVIYAGYLWMTASGNEEQITKAKKMLTNAVIGIIIISLAYVITDFVIKGVTESTGGSGAAAENG